MESLTVTVELRNICCQGILECFKQGSIHYSKKFLPKCSMIYYDLSKGILISQKAAIKCFADTFPPLVDYRDVSESKILII